MGTYGPVLLALNFVWIGVGGRPVGECGIPGCFYHVWFFRGTSGHMNSWSMEGDAPYWCAIVPVQTNLCEAIETGQAAMLCGP
jgi:hypothetical protein